MLPARMWPAGELGRSASARACRVGAWGAAARGAALARRRRMALGALLLTPWQPVIQLAAMHVQAVVPHVAGWTAFACWDLVRSMSSRELGSSTKVQHDDECVPCSRPSCLVLMVAAIADAARHGTRRDLPWLGQ